MSHLRHALAGAVSTRTLRADRAGGLRRGRGAAGAGARATPRRPSSATAARCCRCREAPGVAAVARAPGGGGPRGGTGRRPAGVRAALRRAGAVRHRGPRARAAAAGPRRRTARHRGQPAGRGPRAAETPARRATARPGAGPPRGANLSPTSCGHSGNRRTSAHSWSPAMVYAQPGTEGSIVNFARRYDNFIGGDWVAPAEGAYFENPSPVDRRDLLRGRPLHRARHRTGPGRRARGGGRLGPYVGDRARGDPQQDRRPHRGEPGEAGRRRDVGERQAGPRDARRRPAAGGRPLPLLRRGDPRPGGLDRRDRRGHGGVPLPRAAGRGRPDHPVELPDPDGHLEAGARAGRGQLRGDQARRADARRAC